MRWATRTSPHVDRTDGGCSFEAFLRRSELDDPALWEIAPVAHEGDLEDERHDPPEAPGLHRLSFDRGPLRVLDRVSFLLLAAASLGVLLVVELGTAGLFTRDAQLIPTSPSAPAR